MDRDDVHERIRDLALEVKDMTVGRSGDEPVAPAPVDLGFMDAFARFQFAVYLEEEFDVLLVEKVSALSDGSTGDVEEIVVAALAETP